MRRVLESGCGRRLTAWCRQGDNWLAVGVLATLVAAHTQVTVRHMAWRLAGIRSGVVAKVDPGKVGVRVRDPQALFADGALEGAVFRIGGATAPVVTNGRSWIELGKRPPGLTVGASYLVAGDGWLPRLALRVPGAAVTLADLLLAVTAAGVAVALARQRSGWRQVTMPWAVPALVAAAVAGLLAASWSGAAVQWQAGAKELLQRVEVLVVAWGVFRWGLSTRDSRWRAVAVLGICGAAMVLLAAWEYREALAGRGTVGAVDGLLGFRYNPARPGVAGSESNRNVLAVYLCVMLPVAFGVWPALRQRWLRVAVAAVGGVGVCLVLQVWLLLCAGAGCVAAALVSRHRFGVEWTVAALVGAVACGCLLNSDHGPVLLDSVAVYRFGDRYGTLPAPATGGNADSFPAWDPWQQKTKEVQASLNALSKAPLLGHGIGHYQQRINAFYTDGEVPELWLPKAPVNLMEPGGHGLYWVTAVECGGLGVTLLVMVLLQWLRAAVAWHRQATEERERALAAGVAGSLVAVLLSGMTGSFLVRGVQFLVVALAAAAWNGDSREGSPTPVL